MYPTGRWPELTGRQQEILRLVVQEYVTTAAPVGSRTLVRKYGLDVSPATVRNEMNVLEALGFLAQPHTSAGRVPTELGYRYYVERLAEPSELSPQERARIRQALRQARQEVEAWTEVAVRLLARTVPGTSVATPPRGEEVRFKHCELLSVSPRRVLLVMVLEDSRILQHLLDLEEPLEQEALSALAARLNRALAGKTAAEVSGALEGVTPTERKVLELIRHSLEEAEVPGELVRAGVGYILEEPEFAGQMERLRALLEVLESGELLQRLSPPPPGKVEVWIGQEIPLEGLDACGLVLARYGSGTGMVGVIGVLGPVRMPYTRAIGGVRYVARVLTELLQEAYGRRSVS